MTASARRLAQRPRVRRPLGPPVPHVPLRALLQSEYPDQMAQRSCTCEPEAICGAHRLLVRYHDLYEALGEANRKKRAMRAERDEALAAVEAPQPRVLWRGKVLRGFRSHHAVVATPPLPVPPGTRVLVVEDVADAGEVAQ